MRSRGEGDFESKMHQLIQLLKEMMAHYPDQIKFSKQKPIFQDQAMNFNMIIFNIMPVFDPEGDEWETVEDFFSMDFREPVDFDSRLNAEDIDFLKKHGIDF